MSSASEVKGGTRRSTANEHAMCVYRPLRPRDNGETAYVGSHAYKLS